MARERVQKGGPSRKTLVQTLAQFRMTKVLRWQVRQRRPCMNNVLDLHQNNESDGPTLEEARVYKHVKSHLEHQLTDEKKQCSCTDLKPLHRLSVHL